MKHTAENLFEGQEPLLRKELNDKALVNNDDILHKEIVNKDS